MRGGGGKSKTTSQVQSRCILVIIHFSIRHCVRKMQEGNDAIQKEYKIKTVCEKDKKLGGCVSVHLSKTA